MFKNQKKFIYLILPFFVLSTSLVFTGCNKDDEDDKTEECENFTKIEGSVQINNDNLSLSVATLAVSSGFEGVVYNFLIGGFTSDCNKLISVNINALVPEGGTLNGTYAIKDFFDAEAGDAFGTTTTQQISPISQSLVELASGTVQFTDQGSKKYTIDLKAKTITNEDLTLKVTHTF
ncbi:MAG: hypothetical protein IPN79_13660 [Saprospiraceae bacterium]|nr:hypothetical protein [Saprospiraceae bacterium]